MFIHINVGVILCLGIFSNDRYKTVQAQEVTTASSIFSPKILLERYKNKTSQRWITLQDENSVPELINKDDEDYSVKDSRIVSKILLTCHATYPVYWVMTDVKPLRIDRVATNSRGIIQNFTERVDPEVEGFISYLEVYNDVSYTGLYTCRSFSDKTISTSTYVFLPGLNNKTRTLLGAGQKLEVGLNGKDSIVVPCKVSTKSALVSLLKQDKNGDWTSLSLNSSFDPKIGFKLNKNDVETMEGVYKCTVEPGEEFNVTIVQKAATPPSSAFPYKNRAFGRGFKMNRMFWGDIECCSISMAPPSLFVVLCDNAPECDMKKAAYLNLMPKVTSSTPGLLSTLGLHGRGCSNTEGENEAATSFLLQCKGNSVDISGQFATEFYSPTFEEVKYVPSPSIENNTYNINAFSKLQILKWTNYTNRRGNVVNHFVSLDLRKSYLYAGDRFVVDCCGLHYYHAIGRIQRMIWGNGSITDLETPEKDFSDTQHAYIKDFCGSYKYDPDNADEYLLTAEETMEQVECMVPRWNDHKSAVRRIQLNIKVPKEPVIISSEEVVNVTYNENQVGLLLLECRLSENMPPPQMTWTKDGYKLNHTDIFWSMVKDKDDRKNIISINVLFMRAVKEIEGEYVCTAENWKGTSQKTFQVKVNPRSYLDYWIALVVFGGFFAAIICCALRISTTEKQTAPKKVKPVSFT